MINRLEQIAVEGAEFVKKEFGLKLSDNSIVYYSDKEWKEFCEYNGFDPKSEGIYVPGAKAYVRDSPHLESNIFHELYGHALFCEHSIPGKILVKKQEEGNAKEFLKEECGTYFSITGRNLTDYEGFAMWMESLVCKELGKENIWNSKKETLHPQYIDLWKYFASAEEKLTRYGLMAQMGFPKQYNSEKVLEIIKRIYGTKFEDIDMVLAYGSKKPYSDIDLFIISKDNNMNYFNGWLDIYELNRTTFFSFLKNMDISVTDPIISGELIYGDKNMFENIKKHINEQPVTSEMIIHNRHMAQLNLENSGKTSDDRLRKLGESYSKSYEYNAQALSEGNKLLTLQNIESKYDGFNHI